MRNAECGMQNRGLLGIRHTLRVLGAGEEGGGAIGFGLERPMTGWAYGEEVVQLIRLHVGPEQAIGQDVVYVHLFPEIFLRFSTDPTGVSVAIAGFQGLGLPVSSSIFRAAIEADGSLMGPFSTPLLGTRGVAEMKVEPLLGVPPGNLDLF